MKVPPNGMPALDPWLNERFRELDGVRAGVSSLYGTITAISTYVTAYMRHGCKEPAEQIV